MEWKEIVAQVSDFRQQVFERKRAEPFFRGHANHSWQLQPALFRHSWDPSDPRRVAIDEARLYWGVVQLGSHLLPAPSTPWQPLFVMQHYGIPTRLLDWTESFATALWFALSEPSTDNACVWMLDQFKLNALEAKDEALFLPDYDFVAANGHVPGYEPYVVDVDKRTFDAFPYRISAIAGISAIPRVHSQRGVFTIHRDPVFLAEEDPVLSQCYRKVIIPRDLVIEAQMFLTAANVHSFSVFPDLYGLSRYLRRCVLGKVVDGLL